MRGYSTMTASGRLCLIRQAQSGQNILTVGVYKSRGDSVIELHAMSPRYSECTCIRQLAGVKNAKVFFVDFGVDRLSECSMQAG